MASFAGSKGGITEKLKIRLKMLKNKKIEYTEKEDNSQRVQKTKLKVEVKEQCNG